MKIFFILLILFFVGCGYKPTSEYISKNLGNSIKPVVDINIQNPEDAIFLKDALNEAIVNDYDANISNKAISIYRLSVSSTSISAIGFDANGYPILYRASVNLRASVKDKRGVINNYSAHGTYDFSIKSNSILDDNAKHNAIKEAYLQALRIIEFKIAQKEIDDNQ